MAWQQFHKILPLRPNELIEVSMKDGSETFICKAQAVQGKPGKRVLVIVKKGEREEIPVASIKAVFPFDREELRASA